MEPLERKLALLCPITSRGCGFGLRTQPIFNALLPSLRDWPKGVNVRLILGYDSDDLVWMDESARRAVDECCPYPVVWKCLYALQGNITAIWNELGYHLVGRYSCFAAINDDLTFSDSSIFRAAREVCDRDGFGTVAFNDTTYPGFPTFYVSGMRHLQIFDSILYPLPWQGAHQDPWIYDVYRPWQASEIDPEIVCTNHVGTPPRYSYGRRNGYRDRVIEGRRKVNRFLEKTPLGPYVKLVDQKLLECPTLCDG